MNKILASTLLFLSIAASGADNRQDGDLNTNTQDSTVNSNNTTNSKTYNGAGASGMPVTSAISPSLMSSGNDSCLRSQTGGVQLALVGVSLGKYYQDLECNRRKDAKTLRELGMSVASVSLMCQKLEVWESMFSAGTPCPMLVNSKLVVGKSAYFAMRRYPDKYIPNYLLKKEYYDTALRINGGVNEEENTSNLTISQRFRTSRRNR